MSNYDISSIIKQVRLERNISQEDFCDGICAVSTLSRIESTGRKPHKQILERILHSLELPIRYYYSSNDKNPIRSIVEKQILARISELDFNIGKLISKYKKLDTKMDNLEEQFFLMATGVEQEFKKDDCSVALDTYIKAIKLTILNFSQSNPIRYVYRSFLSDYELFLISSIARIEYKMGQKDIALERLQYVYDYINENERDLSEIYRYYSFLLSTLTDWHGQCKHYEMQKKLASEGIAHCNRFSTLSCLDRFLFFKAYSIAALNNGKHDNGMFLQAFYVIDATQDKDFKKYALRLLKESNFTD